MDSNREDPVHTGSCGHVERTRVGFWLWRPISKQHLASIDLKLLVSPFIVGLLEHVKRVVRRSYGEEIVRRLRVVLAENVFNVPIGLGVWSRRFCV